MYGKYDDDRVRRDVEKFKKLQGVYTDDKIDANFLVQAYNHFIDNMEVLKSVFPYQKIHITEVAMAPYGEVWTWDSEEELERTKEEILNTGMLLPIIVLERGVVHKDKEAGRNKYHVLDGNHRVDVILRLYNENKISGDLMAFVFPEYCIEVRSKMTPEYKGPFFDHTEAVDLHIMPHALNKLKIKEFYFIRTSQLFEKVSVRNRLEIYNCAFLIGHEITPLLYLYALTQGDYPAGIKQNTIKIL